MDMHRYPFDTQLLFVETQVRSITLDKKNLLLNSRLRSQDSLERTHGGIRAVPSNHPSRVTSRQSHQRSSMHEDGKRDPADEDESGASLAAKAHMAKAASVKNFASNLKKERQNMNNKRLYIQLGDASD